MSLVLDTPKSGQCTLEQASDRNLIPTATRTYQPLPNKVMIDMIYRIAREKDIKLSNQQLGLDCKGQRMFGVCDLEDVDILDNKIGLQIGFCNSYDKSISAKFCIGSVVFVCSNRAFHAYTNDNGINGHVVRQHWNYNNDNHHNLIEQIREAFGQIDIFKQSQERFYGGLNDREIRTDDKAYGTIIRAAQAGMINKTKVLTIADEWSRQAVEPIDTEHEWHEEFMPRTAYSLFNAFTQVNKAKIETSPVAANISTMDLTSFFYKEFNLN